jgi:hypothetical protein
MVEKIQNLILKTNVIFTTNFRYTYIYGVYGEVGSKLRKTNRTNIK